MSVGSRKDVTVSTSSDAEQHFSEVMHRASPLDLSPGISHPGVTISTVYD